MRGALLNNIASFRDETIRESQRTYDITKVSDEWTPGAIHDFTNYYPNEGFIFTTHLYLEMCRMATIKFQSHCFIDDCGGFCMKYQGRKWLGHMIFFTNPTGKHCFFGGALLTLDWDSIQGKKKFFR